MGLDSGARAGKRERTALLWGLIAHSSSASVRPAALGGRAGAFPISQKNRQVQRGQVACASSLSSKWQSQGSAGAWVTP